MPLIKKSTYEPSRFFRNGHVNTIYSSLFRKVSTSKYHRIRLETEDKDFLDMDTVFQGSENLVVVLHGMEGSSASSFVMGMVRQLLEVGNDVLVVNFRGCSGAPNRLLSAYHSGKSEDLDWVMKYIVKEFAYKRINLVGFSLGGNVLLKYLGEQKDQLPQRIKKAVAISVPTHLPSSAMHFSRLSNKIYLNRFLKTLKQKVEDKIKTFPDCGIKLSDLEKVKDFYDFDELYTAPVHGFTNANHYWNTCSSCNFLKEITLPTLLLNAQDDPFLTPECYPYEEARNHSFLYLETPKHGGHVGFVTNWYLNRHAMWHEARTLLFFEKMNN